jgi:hypothetical protein
LRSIILVLAWVCSLHPTVNCQEASIEVVVSTTHIDFGQSFEVTVERIWSTGLEPSGWDPSSLGSHNLREMGVDRRTVEGSIVETRRFRSDGFSLGPIVFPSIVFRARPRGAGIDRVAFSDEIVVSVRTEVDPLEPGEAELPGGLLAIDESASVEFVWMGAVVVAGLSLFFLWRRRTKASVSAPKTPLERLALLREDGEVATAAAFYCEISDIVRLHFEQHHGVHGSEMTSEEFLDATSADIFSEERYLREDVDWLLRTCDYVKYGAHSPTPAERLEVVDRAANVLATAVDAP